jgi:hypothetical protein
LVAARLPAAKFVGVEGVTADTGPSPARYDLAADPDDRAPGDDDVFVRAPPADVLLVDQVGVAALVSLGGKRWFGRGNAHDNEREDNNAHTRSGHGGSLSHGTVR